MWINRWSPIYLFILILSCKQATTAIKNDDSFFASLMLQEPIDEAQCDKMSAQNAAIDAATEIDFVPKLDGKWVSSECEVRPGPQFLLRSYYFLRNNTFKLMQFYYGDESCTLPWYTITAKGILFLKEGSNITPGATEAEYTLTRVSINPQTAEMADELSRRLNDTCPGSIKKTWRPHREHPIYRMRHFNHFLTRKSPKERTFRDDVDCLTSLEIEFNELQLIRTQTRPTEDVKNRELLLGDIHSRTKSRFTYKPTSFQVPLIKTDQMHNCPTCHVIARGTERSPPHLISRPRLPPLPHGQWISRRCEVRPLGMFLTRKLSFDSTDRRWVGEYGFHSDPACLSSTFAVSAIGRYGKGVVRNWDKKRLIGTGTEFDFKIDRAKITVYDAGLLSAFNADDRCGEGPWILGVPKDLTPTMGCSMLGIVVPTTEYELLKLEMDNKGNPLLLMGLPDTENRRRGPYERPTSYQPPLVQCSTLPIQHYFNHPNPISYARVSSNSNSIQLNDLLHYLFYCIIILMTH